MPEYLTPGVYIEEGLCCTDGLMAVGPLSPDRLIP